MRFDAKRAKQMLPGEHITFDEFPGLRLQATASRRSWIYRYKSPVDGRMRQTKLGMWPTMSYSAAIAAWEAERAQRDAGVDTRLARRNNAPAPSAGAYTVKQVCLDYIAGHIETSRNKKSAVQATRLILNKLGAVQDLPAADLTRGQAFDLLAAQRHAPQNAAKLRAELGAAWDYALDAGKLMPDTPNWWRQVMRGKLRSKGRVVAGERVTTKRVLSTDELRILIPWLPNFSAAVEDVLTLYLWTALRGAEICAMEGREVREESDGLWWTIPKAKTKNKNIADATDHRVPLVGRARSIVLRRKEQYGAGSLFPARAGVPIKQKIIQHAVWMRQPYSDVPKVEHLPPVPVTRWAPHDLRRTARTLLASLGCPREVGETILGHVLPGVEGIYNRHTYDAEKRVWLTRLSDHLESLVGG
ncbi:TPA: DUF4102 domain-containing protein [Burkholderia cenocepacia]|nr:DUF4102 domain-containing protein [Burkholderia cenocepacia]HDR9875379.1 DUF4102 domain-containing protein [Burkholderia cenocepacia]